MSSNDKEVFEIQVEVFKLSQQKKFEELIPKMFTLQKAIEQLKAEGEKASQIKHMRECINQSINELSANYQDFFHFLHELRK